MIVKIEGFPYELRISKNRMFKINFNKYRNTHHHTLAKAKRQFNEWVATLGLDYTYSVPVQLRYSIWCRSNADMMNYGVVLDKFLQDALVKFGVLKDDNVKHVKNVQFDFHGIHKHPKAILEIHPHYNGGK